MNKRRNKKSFIVLLIFFGAGLLIFSCSEEDGKWDDNIKLSKKEATFDVLKDSTTFTTEGEGWWISGVSLNNIQVDLENINTTEDNFEIINEDFFIRRNSKTELFVRMEENATDEDRILQIGLQSGNYFDGVTITQNKE